MEKRTALVMTGLHGHGLGELALKIPVSFVWFVGCDSISRARAQRKDSEMKLPKAPDLIFPYLNLN